VVGALGERRLRRISNLSTPCCHPINLERAGERIAGELGQSGATRGRIRAVVKALSGILLAFRHGLRASELCYIGSSSRPWRAKTIKQKARRFLRWRKRTIGDHETYEAIMASQITCITKPDPYSTREAITHVGGIKGTGDRFYISRRQCANDIRSGREPYYVHVSLYKTNVEAYQRNGVWYIRTKPDSTRKDNLLSLPQCR